MHKMVSVVQEDVIIDHPQKQRKHANQNYFSFVLKFYALLKFLPYQFIWDKDDGLFYLKSTWTTKVYK